MRISFNPAVYTIPKNNYRNNFNHINHAPNFSGKIEITKEFRKPVSEDIPGTYDEAEEYFRFSQSLQYQGPKWFEDIKTKLTIRKYDRIEGHSIISSTPDIQLKDAADRTAHIASKLKRKLDAKYGKDSYVFVSVGRKPSLVAKAFEFLGVETRYLPVPKKNSWESGLKEPDFKLYGDFLKSQGITPEDMKASSKKYLFYDYSDGTRRLENFAHLMKTRYGLPEECIEYRSLNKDLGEIKSNKTFVDSYIKQYLANPAYVDKYTSIADLPDYVFTSETFTPEKLTRHDIPDVKLFNYFVISSLDKKGMLEGNPNNDNAL